MKTSIEVGFQFKFQFQNKYIKLTVLINNISTLYGLIMLELRFRNFNLQKNISKSV